jgi:hypothetical protein
VSTSPAILRVAPPGRQSTADDLESRAVERFIRFREFARAVHLAALRGEILARLDLALRRGRT